MSVDTLHEDSKNVESAYDNIDILIKTTECAVDEPKHIGRESGKNLPEIIIDNSHS